MSQTVVNFLTASQTSPTNVNLVTDPRIFNFEIDQTAQLYYTQQMQALQSDLSTVPPTAATLQDISNILNNLNNWSGMISVQSNVPVINPVTLVITGYTTAQTYSVDGNIEPVTANGTVVPIVFNSSGQPVLNANGAATLSGATTPEFIASDGTVLTSTMNQYMAQDLDQIIRTFRSAGWDPTENPVGSAFYNATTAQNAITTIQGSPAVYGLLDFTDPTTGATDSGLITQALKAAASANIIGQESATQSNNIQQLLMVGYIATGNQILSNQLSQLQNAINTNQSVLSYLNALQDLMNQKSPQQFILQLQLLNNLGSQDPSTQLSNVNNFENQSYNQAINVVSKINGSSPTAIKDYLNAAAGLQANITLQNNLTSTTTSTVFGGLSAVTPDSTSINAAQALNALNQAIVTAVANAPPASGTPGSSFTGYAQFNQMTALGLGGVRPVVIGGQLRYIFVYQTSPTGLLSSLQTLAAGLTPNELAYLNSTSTVALPTTPVNGVAIPAGWSNPPTVLQYTAYQLAANLAGAPVSQFTTALGRTESGILTPGSLTSVTLGLLNSSTTSGPAGANLGIGAGLNALIPQPTTSTLLSQAWAVSLLASDMATASTSGPISGLTSSDPTAVQTALQSLIAADTSLTASQVTYLTSILQPLLKPLQVTMPP